MSTATVLLLGACTGDGSPGPTPPTGLGTFSYTPSPEPSPTETPAPETVHPDRPDAMDQDGVEGAEATARYFLELYRYVYSTGDLTEWHGLTHPECLFCSSVVEGVEEDVEAGHTWRGGEMTIQDVVAQELSATAARVIVTATQGVITVTDAGGQVVDETPASRAVLTLVLVREDPSWLVRAVEVEPAA